MTFFRRILSGDYRRAVAAEAAGEYAEAARHYALCGERGKVADMHLLRAERAGTVAETIDELRDALRWADAGTPARPRVLKALARALVKRARAEGAATVRDAAALREAAGYFDEAGEHREAGEILERVGDDEAAARIYEKGGLVDEMEAALGRERERRRRDARLRDGFARYQDALERGRRDEAVTELTACVEAATDKGEYRRLLEELRARLITSGHVTLRRRPDGRRLSASGLAELRLGREPTGPLPLRDPSVSRAHVALRHDGGRWLVRDAGSRTGTWMGGARLDGEIPLSGEGALRLGEDTELAFVAAAALRLEVTRGLDRGTAVVLVAPGAPLELATAAELRAPARLHFRDGRPLLEGDDLTLGGTPVQPPVQLCRGDVISVAGVELEVVS